VVFFLLDIARVDGIEKKKKRKKGTSLSNVTHTLEKKTSASKEGKGKKGGGKKWAH